MEGGQRLRAAPVHVPADPSSAAFLAAAALIVLTLMSWLQLKLAAHRRRQRELERQVQLRTADLAELFGAHLEGGILASFNGIELQPYDPDAAEPEEPAEEG